jgi:putative heme-binding domain-containing protein
MQKYAAAIRGFMALAVVTLMAMPAGAQDHSYSAEQIQSGYRLYASQCQLCHAPNGDGVAGISLSRQQFRAVSTDEEIRKLISTGSSRGMPGFMLGEAEMDGVIAFIRSGMDQRGVTFRLGDASRGKMVFEGKGNCASCHRVAGKGARTAPDLTDIGFLRRPGQLFNSLTEPAKQTMPINRPVDILLRDGSRIKGRRYDEDTLSVRLIDSAENMRSIQKAEILRYDVRKDTDMPSFRGVLTDAELGDVLSYLLSLKG